MRVLRHLGAVRASGHLLGRTVGVVLRIAPAATAAYLAGVLLLSALPVVQVWLLKQLVDTLAEPRAAATGVLVLGAGYALTLIVPAALGPLQLALGAWLEDCAVAEVDRRLMAAAARLQDLQRIERPAFGDELRRLEEVPRWLPRLVPALDRSLGSALTLLGLLALLAGLHPLLPLALVALSVPHLLGEYRLQGLQFEALAARSRAAREMDYCLQITTEPDAAKEVRVFGLGPWFLSRFRARVQLALSEMTRLRLRSFRLAVAYAAGYAVALGAGFGYVAAQAAAGRLTAGDVALYVATMVQAQSLLVWVRVGIATTHEILQHVGAFFRFVDGARPAIAVPPPMEARPAPARLQQGIALENVAFGYPEGTTAVLDNVSVTLAAGKVTALVGENGAGKSTLVKLLTRMYDPAAGTIRLDGEPLAAYDLASLRLGIAVVYQDFARFSLTLRDNIAVAGAAGGLAEERLTDAARVSGADAVARALLQGYATELTRRFEGGVELSGGEWQKVAVARGFVRDAALVILDEPSAALDAAAEEHLFAQFRTMMRERTGLLISHRFSTVRMADHIVVLEGGRVLEQGTHAELLERGGRYAELFEMQAGRYRDS